MLRKGALKAICTGLTLTMAAGLFIGCGGKGSSAKSGTKYVAQKEKNGVVNNAKLKGLPVVKKPVTLTVGVGLAPSAYVGKWEDLEWVKALQKASGIKFKFRVYNSSEDTNLMFTSRDYPDISFNVGNDKQIQDAANGGDIYQLDDLIDKFSPNWSSYLKENDYCKKVITMNDGHIYSLPNVRDEPSNGQLRDQWLIRKDWLDELGLEMPKTTTDFYNVLKAFKEHAGKGSIPKNVMPFYTQGLLNNVGGALDVFCSFGVRVSTERYYVTVDDNKKVEFNFNNEAIKEPLKYLRKLYDEELIPGECLTNDYDTYIARTESNPPVLGCFDRYQNPDATNTKIAAMGPLDAENGQPSLIRSQTNSVMRNYFTIYKKCKYPEAAMRLADLIADPDWSIQAMYGMFGDEYLKKEDDGSVTMLPYEADAQGKTSAPLNRVAFLLKKEMFDHFTYADGSAQQQRNNAIEDQYKEHIIPSDNMYPNVVFSEKQTDRLSELATDIHAYINTTFSTWMKKGDIDKEWDAYVKQLDELGLKEYIQILQTALDNFNNNK